MLISRESAAFAKVGFANVAAGYFRQTCYILFKPAGSFSKIQLPRAKSSHFFPLA
jgi:hypothetical protein